MGYGLIMPDGFKTLDQARAESRPLIEETPAIAGPSFSQIFLPAWKRETFGGRVFDQFTDYIAQRSFTPEPDFDSTAYIRPGDMEEFEGLLGDLALARSPEEMDYIRDSIRKERADRELLSKANGWTAAGAYLAAGFTDPINLIPLGAVASTANLARKGLAVRALAEAGKTAGIAGATQAVTEFVKQATLYEPPSLDESVVNIGFASLLGGVLGAGAASLPKSQRAAMVESIRKEYESGGFASKLGSYMPTADQARLMTPDEIQTHVFRQAVKEYPSFTKASESFGFLVRGMAGDFYRSEIGSERLFGQLMLDTPLARESEIAGVVPGAPAELAIKQHTGKLAELHLDAQETHQRWAADPANPAPDKSYEAFDVLVSQANIRGDKLDIPGAGPINEMAAKYRKFYDFYAQEGLRLHSFEADDFDLKGTAKSYRPKMYLDEKIGKLPNQFKEEVLFPAFEENGLDKAHWEATANDIIAQITLPGPGKQWNGRIRVPGVKKERRLLIRDDKLTGWVEERASVLARKYLYQIAPEVELKRALMRPNVKMDELGKEIENLRIVQESLPEVASLRERINNLRSVRTMMQDPALDVSRAKMEGLIDEVAKLEKSYLLEPLVGEAEVSIKRLESVKAELKSLRETARAKDAEIASDIKATRTNLQSIVEIEQEMADLRDEFISARKADHRATINGEYDKADIRREYQAKITEKGDKAAKKLTKQMKRALENVDVAIQKASGLYGLPKNPDAWPFRVSQTLKRASLMTKNGGFMLGSMPDPGYTVMVTGFKPVGRALEAIITAPLKFFGKASQRDLGKMEMVLETAGVDRNIMRFADVRDDLAKGNWFDRSVHYGAEMSTKLSLLNKWNGGIKRISGLAISDDVLRNSVKWADGTLSDHLQRKLLMARIDKKMAMAIADEVKAGHIDIEEGIFSDLYMATTHKWADQAVAKKFESAVLFNIRRGGAFVPGIGDLPNLMSTPLGGLLLQFKSFGFAAVNRILVPALQAHDLAALNGALMALALGTGAYAFRAKLEGKKISGNPADWVMNGIDRSGLLGIFMDVNNMADNFTHGRLSLNRVIGADPATRYRDFSIVQSLLGPVGGTLENLGRIGAIPFDEKPFSQADLRRIKNTIMPGQNAFWLRELLDEGIVKMGKSWRLPDPSGLRRKEETTGLIQHGGLELIGE